MKTIIKPLEEGKTFVEVCFIEGDVTHIRNVNAVFTEDIYDEEATKQRVDEIALGVKVKIDNSVIKNAEEPSEDKEAEAQEEFSFD